MLININELYGSKLAASDGRIGHVKDFYFDDQTWAIRYLVVDTGSWLTGRLVLLAPQGLGKLDQYEKTLHVRLHKKQIENSPSIESHQPVSRLYETEYYRYYGWPAYWDGGAGRGPNGKPVPSKNEEEVRLQPHLRDDKHLQSTQALHGYEIQTADGIIGAVNGFMVHDRSWTIRELIVEAGNWYSGREILIPPDMIDRINPEASSVLVNLTKADIHQIAGPPLAQSRARNHGAQNLGI